MPAKRNFVKEAQELIERTELNAPAKKAAYVLLEQFGVDWWMQLAAADEIKGPGYSGIELAIDILDDDEEGDSTELPCWELDPLDLYDQFLFNAEELFNDEDFLDDDDDEDEYLAYTPVTAFLAEWRDERIAFRRTVLKEKTNDARWKTYAELDEIDFGGREGACRTCGKIFYDNFWRKLGEEAYYCSLPCIGKAEFNCLECGEHYVVGTGSNRENRRRRLSGWCSEKCETPWIDADPESRGWVAAMVRRARELNRDFDSDITRRKVFEKANGVCFYCGIDTRWKTERFAPELATVDHVLPWEKGGHHTWDNVVLSCWLCNAMKGTRLEFGGRGSRTSWKKR